MRVGFDLDGVLYDFGRAYREHLRSTGYDHPALATESQVWDISDELGLTPEQFEEYYHDGVNLGQILLGPAHEGGPEAVRSLKAAGHSIHIITAREGFGDPGRARERTLEWLASHDIPFDTLTLAHDKTNPRTDVFIEDKIENYDALEAAGIPCYLVDRPWNAVAGGDDRRRVPSAAAFAQEILNFGIVPSWWPENVMS